MRKRGRAQNLISRNEGKIWGGGHEKIMFDKPEMIQPLLNLKEYPLTIRLNGVIIKPWGIMMLVDFSRTTRILNSYFPGCHFFYYDKKHHIGEPSEILYKCIREENGNIYIDIPQMTGINIFSPLFPEAKIVQQYAKELETEFNQKKDTDEWFNVLEFYIEKIGDAGKFADNLRTKLRKDVNHDSIEKILQKLFFSEDYSCQYSPENNEDKFIWNFENLCSHKGAKSSIYKAFYYYARRKCNLYLYGAQFAEFKEHRANKFTIPNGNGQPLHEYLKEYNRASNKKINIGDFVWKDGKWDEEKNKQHLLECFNLDENINISLEDIYYSFCYSLVKEKDYSDIGYDIIKYTLERDIPEKEELKGPPFWFDKIWDMPYSQYEKDEIINGIPYVWKILINEILESKPDNIGEHCPTDFETFIWQVVWQTRLVEIKAIKTAATEYGVLDSNDYDNINNYWGKVLENEETLSDKEREKINEIVKNGNAYKKIKQIYKLMSFPAIRNLFKQTQYSRIEALYKKAFPATEGQGKNEDGDTENDAGYPLEDKKQLTLEQVFTGEELKKIVIASFEVEFKEDSESEWIQFIKKEETNILFDDLKAYPPRRTERLRKATDSNLFKKYCKIMSITDELFQQTHNVFAEKMRNVTDSLELKLKELGYQRE
jgi:hypothetical protein